MKYFTEHFLILFYSFKWVKVISYVRIIFILFPGCHIEKEFSVEEVIMWKYTLSIKLVHPEFGVMY